jgi:hypothetical protein
MRNLQAAIGPARSYTCLLLSAALLGLSFSNSQGQAQPPATRTAAAQRATCVLLLQGGGTRAGGRGMDIKTVGEIITSTAFADAAVKASLGLEPEQWPAVAQIELAPAGEQAIKLIISVRAAGEMRSPEKPAAALLKEITTRAQSEVARLAGDPAVRQQLLEQIAALQKRKDEAGARVVELQKKLDEMGFRRVSPGIASSGQQQVQQLREQLERNRVRLGALESVLGGLDKGYLEIDAAARELIELHAKKVALVEELVRDGRATPLELVDAQIALAHARSQRLSSAGARLSPLERFFNEVVTLRVEIAVAEAQLERLGAPVAAATRPGASPEDPAVLAERLRRELGEAQQQLTTANNEMTVAQRKLDELGPTLRLVVMDGSD